MAFAAAFHHHKGESIGRYIREKKLRLAAQDLRATNDRVLDISMKYGFDSQQTFTRLFTRKYRMSPGTWRKQGDAPTNH